MLADSNIVIYSAQSQHAKIKDFILEHHPISVSAISYLEVLGYHLLDAEAQHYFEVFFQNVSMLPVSGEVIKKATVLRQQKKMSLGDAIIAATALLYDLTLVTHNVKDFDWINELSVLDPFDE
jgi:toxin FitB